MKIEFDNTTKIATAKIVTGILGLVAFSLNVIIPNDIQDAIVTFTTTGYLILSWLQGFFTKDKELKNERIGNN